MNVLITGATKGLGKAMAEKFAEEGADLAICARNEQDLKTFKTELINRFGIDVLAVPCDVSDKDQVFSFAEKVKEHWKKIDVLVNNAGIFIPGKITEEEDSVMELQMHTNFNSAYYLTKQLLPLMLPFKSGHIFSLCSVASLQAYPNGGSYSISKFALLGYTKTLREELKEHGIKVTALNLGAVYTASWEGVDIPKDRFADAEDVASLVYDIYKLSKRTVVEEVLVRPMLGDI